MRASVTVEYIDKVTGPADKAAQSFDKFERAVSSAEKDVNKLARAEEKLGATSQRSSRKAVEAMRREKLAIREREREYTKAENSAKRREANAARHDKNRDRIKNAAKAGVATAVLVAGASIKGSANDEEQFDHLAILAEKSDAAFKKYATRIKKIGAKYGLGTKGAGSIYNELMAGGMDVSAADKLAEPVAIMAKATQSSQEDIARSTVALQQNLGIASKDIMATFDAMAYGGKAGQFELRDMAKHLPSIGAKWAAYGGKGKRAAQMIVAAGQSIRKMTGTSSEAATNFENLLGKLGSPDVIKRLSKIGINVKKTMLDAKENGLDPVFELLQKIKMQVGDDPFKLGEIIPDVQARDAMRALISDWGEFVKLYKSMDSKAAGSVMRDFEQATANANSAWDRFSANVANKAKSMAEHSLPMLTKAMNTLSDTMEDEGPKIGFEPSEEWSQETKDGMAKGKDRGQRANRWLENLFGLDAGADTKELRERERRENHPIYKQNERGAPKSAPKNIYKDYDTTTNMFQNMADGKFAADFKKIEGEAKATKTDVEQTLNSIDTYAAGVKTGNQLAAGMRASKPNVASAANELAATASAHFPQSPAKKGPLKNLPLMGRKISQQLAGGMDKESVGRSARNIASRIAGSATKSRKGSAKPIQTNAQKTVTVNTGPITITGVKDAAQAMNRLGASLESRLNGTLADVGSA